MIPLFAVVVASTIGVSGFVEDFSGAGPYMGLHSPGWRTLESRPGTVAFSDGRMHLAIDGAFSEVAGIQRNVFGQGSFRSTLEFEQLSLVDLELGVDASIGLRLDNNASGWILGKSDAISDFWGMTSGA